MREAGSSSIDYRCIPGACSYIRKYPLGEGCVTGNYYSIFSTVGVICFLLFAVSIPFVLTNGIYLFQLFDQFAATIPLLLVGLIEFFAIGWVVGVER